MKKKRTKENQVPTMDKEQVGQSEESSNVNQEE